MPHLSDRASSIARVARRLLIVGWDAADWTLIDQLFAAGQLPHLRRLVEAGVRSDLLTLEPRLSPLLWTSIATGKTADKHGVLNFTEPDTAGSGLRLASSTTRRTKALWNILTQAGMTVNVVSWYASHPAEPIRGTCVSNILVHGEPGSGDAWKLTPSAVHPQSAASTLAPLRVSRQSIGPDVLRRYVPRIRDVAKDDERLRTLAIHVAQARSVHRVTKKILADANGAWDCTMAFFESIDTIGHHFMALRPPQMAHVSKRDVRDYGEVMDEVYREHDAMLGELLAAAGPETTVMLLSDHGFFNDHRRPVITKAMTLDSAEMESLWHRPIGMLVLSGPGIRAGARTVSANILDAAPTALALLGLPMGSDMDGRVLMEVFETAPTTGKVPSWDDEQGDAGMHPPDLRQDPFEAHDAIRQLIDLGYMAELPEGTAAQIRAVERESKFNLAVVFMTTGRFELAIPPFAELAAAFPEQPRFVLGLANCQLKSGRFDEAAATAREFLSRFDDSAEARALLAAALIAVGRCDDGATEIQRIERDKGDRSEFQGALGDLYFALGSWDDATRHYQSMIKNDARAPHGHLGLARVALARKQFEPCAEHCLDGLEIQHVQPEAHYLLGVALAWLNDLDHAVQSLEVAIGMQPGLVEAHRFLVAIHGRRGNATAAAKHRDAIAQLFAHQPAKPAPESPTGPEAWVRAS